MAAPKTRAPFPRSSFWVSSSREQACSQNPRALRLHQAELRQTRSSLKSCSRTRCGVAVRTVRGGSRQASDPMSTRRTFVLPGIVGSPACLFSESIFLNQSFFRKLFENNLPRRQGETRRTPGVGGCSIVYRRIIGGAES